MAITPLDIKKKAFATQLRGFSQTEVKAFLQLVAGEMEELRKERAMLAEQVDETTARLETYQKTEKLLHDTLVTAQKATGELRDGAKHEAEMIVEKSKLDAERIRLDHETKMAKLNEELRHLQVKRANMIDEIAGIARTYLGMADRLHKGAPAVDEPGDTEERTGDTGKD
jgi:cell division initiation protein